MGSGPGPVDKTRDWVGTWRLLPGEILELAPSGQQPSLQRIVEVGRDRLVLAR